MGLHVAQHVCGDLSSAYWTWFSLTSVWALGIEVRLSHLVSGMYSFLLSCVTSSNLYNLIWWDLLFDI